MRIGNAWCLMLGVLKPLCDEVAYQALCKEGAAALRCVVSDDFVQDVLQIVAIKLNVVRNIGA